MAIGLNNDFDVLDFEKIKNKNFSLKNEIINGNFDIWQRGTSLTSGTGARYLADRWLNGSVNSTYTVSQQSFTLGQTSVPHEPTFFHRTMVTSIANTVSYCVLQHMVESVRILADKTATLSFWAKADSNKNIAIECFQDFGTGGTPSTRVTTLGVTTCQLTSSWKKFSITLVFPSINGKILGTNNDNYLGINIWMDAGASFNSRTNSLGQQSGTFDIAQVQLEEGDVVTIFEERPISLELYLCQRYFQSVGGTGAWGRVISATQIEISGSLLKTMRVAPVPSFRSSSIQLRINNVNNVIFTITNIAASNTSEAGWLIVLNGSGNPALTVGAMLQTNSLVDIENFLMSADF